MAAAADVTAGIMAGIAGLGVPWWGWTALLVMVFWGLLGPSGQDEPEPEKAWPDQVSAL
jgi:hypothetical protein